MLTRRTFLQASAAMAIAARARPVLGANDRVRMAVIGCGTRGTMVTGYFGRHADCEFVAACDVAGAKRDALATKLREGGSGGGARTVDAVEDYRRILDRNDVDAVLIATPDHWHSPMTMEACAAGKDVYVEKPVSNAIEPAQKMIEAARTHNRVVQVGIQQRQGEHFKEAAALIQDGLLGKVTHVELRFPDSYTLPPEPTQDPPADLNWEMFQGPAQRHPYKPSRQRRWRTYYDYGGGLVTDWGVHLVDVAHWYLNANTKTPRLTTAVAQYVNVANPEQDQVPDAFTVSWQYEDFVMSFTNVAMTTPSPFGLQGTYFFGPRGSLQVNRGGFEIRPSRRPRNPSPGTPPPLETRLRPFAENYENDPDTIAHVRDFLDCVKSRKRPVGDIEIGFYSSLPCLLGIEAIRQGRAIAWDGTSAKPV
jgi:predicted dehydrogenase